jgi:hypothetical protein
MLYNDANKCAACPRLTGIPPHVALLNEMAALRDKIEQSSTDIVTAFKSELNVRGIGGETFQANQILDDVKRVHERMETMIQQAGTRVRQDEFIGEGGIRLPVLQEADSDVPVLVADEVVGRRRKMYCWGGQLHNVPENFKLPRMTLQTLITFWFCGSTQPHCPPPCNMPDHSTSPEGDQQ